MADDSSAVFWNTAGLAFYQGKGEINIGFYAPYIKLENQRTSAPYQGEKTKSDTINPIPHFFACYKITEDLVIGFGIYFPYGGGRIKFTDAFDPDSFYSQKFSLEKDLRAYTFTIAAGYRVSDILSAGLGFSLYHITLETQTTHKTLAAGTYGNTYEMTKGTTFSGSAGLMIKPVKELSLGLSVRLPVNLTLEGDFEISDSTNTGAVPNGSTASYKKIKAPLNIGFGVGYYASPKWLVSMDIEYQMWAMADDVQYKTAPSYPEKTYHYGWKNTFRFGLGSEYSFNSGVSLMAGFKINPGAAEENFLGLDNIDLTAYAFFLGMGFRLSEHFKTEFGISYVYYPAESQTAADANVAVRATGDFRKSIYGAGLQLKYYF